jgi:transposase
MNALADADPETIRISIDTKATVNVGEYSRGGRSRGVKAVKALDHDMRPKEKLIPGGILEPVSGKSFLFFGTSYKTSDFIVDGLFLWWEERKQELFGIKNIVINTDNGPECSGHRSQFLLRLTEFVDMAGLSVRIIYYPPYHSKYNSIERYWAGLEKSWNGYLLNSVEIVLKRAGNFFWKGNLAITRLLDVPYEKGVKVCGDKKSDLEKKLQRSPDLPWWDIAIYPNTVYS